MKRKRSDTFPANMGPARVKMQISDCDIEVMWFATPASASAVTHAASTRRLDTLAVASATEVMEESGCRLQILWFLLALQKRHDVIPLPRGSHEVFSTTSPTQPFE